MIVVSDTSPITSLLQVGAGHLLPELFGQVIIPEARKEGVAIIGLVGLVILAKKKKLIQSATELFERLESTAGMYVSADLKAQALKAIGE